MEFARHEVAKAKIRILYPKPDAQDAPVATVRSVDIMIDMPAKTARSGANKEGT